MRQTLFCSVMLLLTFPVIAAAECPEGKSEVTMTTPSGKEKVHCVSDNAIPGIENAADHSAVEIGADCPCWSLEELEAVVFEGGGACMTYHDALGAQIANISTHRRARVIDSERTCSFKKDLQNTIRVENLSDAELQACNAIVKESGLCVDDPEVACFVTGCSSQLCGTKETITTCDYPVLYNCLNGLQCGRSELSGDCGFAPATSDTGTCVSDWVQSN